MLCWQVAPNGRSQYMKMFQHPQKVPTLCTTFVNDSVVVFGSCDNKAYMWDLKSGNCRPIAAHQKPIKSIASYRNLVATGSWDRTVRYWDCRSQTPKLSVQLPERLYDMDVRGNFLVAACAQGHVWTFDLRKPQQPVKRDKSKMQHQTRCVKIFPDCQGYALGAVCGKVSINYFRPSANKKDFMFKCHRDGKNVYSVNDIAFHPLKTFATVGSDGQYVFWDKDSRQRLHLGQRHRAQISCCNFSSDGKLFAYSTGYDWSKGAEGYQNKSNRIYIHVMKPSEIKPKPSY